MDERTLHSIDMNLQIIKDLLKDILEELKKDN